VFRSEHDVVSYDVEKEEEEEEGGGKELYGAKKKGNRSFNILSP
jgi:hypothetical protein